MELIHADLAFDNGIVTRLARLLSHEAPALALKRETSLRMARVMRENQAPQSLVLSVASIVL